MIEIIPTILGRRKETLISTTVMRRSGRITAEDTTPIIPKNTE
jgi:hypothetical protein